MSDLIWARDRDTGKTGQYAESYLAAWPHKFYRLAEPPQKTKMPTPASIVPQGTDKERSV